MGFESRTINIYPPPGAAVANRIWLKGQMEQFGRVEICHTGNRMNPEAEPPWVRFVTTGSAESALQAINAGQVLMDGQAMRAEMKSNRRPPANPRNTNFDRGMDVPSRRD